MWDIVINGRDFSRRNGGKFLFFCLPDCLRKTFSLKFIYEDFTINIFKSQFVYDLFTKFDTADYLFTVHLRDVKYEKFTKSLPKFVYFIYEAFPKIWLEFFTVGLR